MTIYFKNDDGNDDVPRLSYAEKQAAREERLKEAAQNCLSFATKQHPWGEFVPVGPIFTNLTWNATLFFKTKAAAEYHATKIAGFKVYAIAKVTGL